MSILRVEMEELTSRTRVTSLVPQRSVRNVAEAQSEAILLRKFQEERVEIWNFS